MTQIYGSYWSDDQVIITSIYEGDVIPHSIFKTDEGAPAFIAGIVDVVSNRIKDYVFVEIIPGTEHVDHFLNLLTGQFESGRCVEINIWEGKSYEFKTMTLVTKDSWPLAWFKLSDVPPLPGDPYTAYERAMAVIGG